MKKIFTLIISLGALTSVFAQDHSRDAKDMTYSYAKTSVYSSSFSSREKDAQIEKINRDFDWKIASVQHDRRLSRREKERNISMLQRQKNDQIQDVMRRFSNSHSNDRYSHNTGRY